MRLTEEQVIWGAASMLLKRYGDEAPVKVAERIGELALSGDELGCALWKAIAHRMNQMLHSSQVH